MAETGRRTDSFCDFNLLIEFDAIARAAFIEERAPKATNDVIKYREGPDYTTVRGLAQNSTQLRYVQNAAKALDNGTHGARVKMAIRHGADGSGSLSTGSASGTRLANTLSIVLPSMSTISKRQLFQVTVSASLGRRPVSSMIMPLSVW